MKHYKLHLFKTFYGVCREGGKVVYHFVETQPESRIQDRSLKDFYRQIEEHGYDVLTPSDKDFEQIVSAYNATSKRAAKKDELSSYDHYKPESICTCGRWMFFEHYPYSSEKKSVEIAYKRSARSKAERPAKEKMDSIRVTAFEKVSIKLFLDWLRETNRGDKSVLSALREAQYTMESKAEKYEESPTLQSMAEDLRKCIKLIEELEEKLPRI